jgi:hypothetical protein
MVLSSQNVCQQGDFALVADIYCNGQQLLQWEREMRAKKSCKFKLAVGGSS